MQALSLFISVKTSFRLQSLLKCSAFDYNNNVKIISGGKV